MTRALVVAAVLSAVSGRAHGDVWRDAIDNGDPNHAQYDHQLAAGDNFAIQATAVSVTFGITQRNVDAALLAYNTASKLEPTAAEPYYRAGRVLYAMYFNNCAHSSQGLLQPAMLSPLCLDSDPTVFTRDAHAHQIAEDLIADWDAFEQRAPLDPRLTTGFLFERAILHTKLATPEHWARAAKDYEAILDRDDFVDRDSTVSGNLAETYMMLGRLDDAIEMYRRSLREGSPDAMYGLAVALDRDDQGEQAKDYIREYGIEQYNSFSGKISSGQWFFVPDGERFYYVALIEEAFGDTDTALADWQHYIASGAHPQFQPRAKAHVAALEKLPPPKKHALEELDESAP
nr:hypothetical protein [Kofleriaceae bacterium]